MSEKADIPESLRQQTESIGSEIVGKDLLEELRIKTELQDRSYKLRTVVNAWKAQESLERDLRKAYANWLLGGFFAQLFVITAAFFLIGFDVIQIPTWVANGFIIGTFAELASLMFVVTKYLFPDRAAKVIDLIERL